ncbi:MAG: M23 family metallopeptidase [Streptomyces sp.]
MNDPHPSGYSPPADSSTDFSYAPYGAGHYEQPAFDSYAQQEAQQGYPGAYDGWSTGAYDNNFAVSYGDGDPLFGTMPGADTTGYATGTGTYDAYADYGTADYGTYDTSGYDSGAYDSGSYDATGYDNTWAHSGYPAAGIPAQAGSPEQAYATGQWDAGQWDSGQWNAPAEGGSWDTPPAEAAASFEHDAHQYATPQYDAYAYDYEFDAAAQGYPSYESYETPGFQESFESQEGYDYAAMASEGHDGLGSGYSEPEFAAHPDPEPEFGPEPVAPPEPAPQPEPEAAPPPGPGFVPVGAGSYSRGRRLVKPRRSALLTVAVPSIAVMGVAAAAAASVMDQAPDDDTTTQASASDAAGVKPANSKLDTQLAGLSADADDFADRASRTQERIDLQERQEAERERKAKAAARKEALRPKFALPVKQQGLSATFGQAGLNWLSGHSGIDFPVSNGTPVMAATDGTVLAKYDMSFGNMAVVTAPDGTETWYCHLSSTKIRSGTVKAGDTIGYSGTSGNSTGPHLHFEVHPGGGAAIDPLAWLRSKGLDPS